MAKQVNKEALAKMVTLQKGYIDQGDQQNAEALRGIQEDLNTLELQVSQNKEHILDHDRKLDALMLKAPSVIGELSGFDATFKSVRGDTQALLKYWVPVLIDTSKEGIIPEGSSSAHTYKCRKLKRNNWLRFEDGTFAPVVGITQEQYDDFMTNEIVRVMGDGINSKRYPAGTFDAVKEWEEWKMFFGYAYYNDGSMEQYASTSEIPNDVDSIWRYYKVDSAGERTLLTHILRPWETPDTKYTIGIANISTLYLFEGSVSKDGSGFRGIFLSPGLYNSWDYSKWKLPPTAISPGPITTIQENGVIKARNFFYLYSGIDNCRSHKGLLPENPCYEADRTYPRALDINQVNNMKYARNNNADPLKPYPFAEGGYHALNMFITAIELAAGTKYIHQANLFGSGISTNDNVNAATILQNGGIRVRPSEELLNEVDPENINRYSYKYVTWSTDSTYANLTYNRTGSPHTDMSTLWSYRWPKEQCLESQMALSMAVELNVYHLTIPSDVTNGTEDPLLYAKREASFIFYGNRYYYMTVPGFEGPLDGSMNARVYKMVGANVTNRYPKKPKGYLIHTIDDTRVLHPGEFDVEAIYRFSLFNGVNLTGDIQAYYGGGLEILGHGDSSATGNTIKFYAEPNQTLWKYETIIANTPDNNVPFSFETSYEGILTTYNIDNTYIKNRENYTPWGSQPATSIAEGECYYQFNLAKWNPSYYSTRIGLNLRGYSSSRGCSPRTVDMTYRVDAMDNELSGSDQVLVEFE